MTITTTGRRWALVGLLALIAALIPLSGASAAHLDDGVLDLDADENVGAALEWSQEAAYPQEHLDTVSDDTGSEDGPARVLIGRDDIFPDNLASGALQGDDTTTDDGTDTDNGDGTDEDGQLLLTPTEELDPRVADEIERLGVEAVTILGNENAISFEVEDELETLVDEVVRYGGPTRIETAIEITQASGATTALLARGYDAQGGDSSQAYVDSLAAGAWAADEEYGVLLTQTEVLTGNTAAFLEDGQIENVIIIGGNDAVSAETEAQVEEILGEDNVDRVGGGNRFATAAEIAAARGFDDSNDADGVILSEGAEEAVEGNDEADTWADGLPAAHTSAIYDFPVLLTDGDRLPGETAAFIVTDDDTTNDSTVICGPYVDDEVCEEFANQGDNSESGVVTEVDTENDTYTFEGDTNDALIQVEYDVDADTFIVDGEEVDGDEFEDNLFVGVQVEVTVESGQDGTETLIHELTTVSG